MACQVLKGNSLFYFTLMLVKVHCDKEKLNEPVSMHTLNGIDD